MATFLGNIEAKIDTKARVFIPSTYRKNLPEAERERIVMRIDTDNDCVVIYPESTWLQLVERLKDRLDEWNPNDRMLLMQFVSDADLVDIDSQGRILIPKRYMSIFWEENTVVFVGMVDRIALWSKAKYDNTKLSREDFAKQLSDKMKAK